MKTPTPYHQAISKRQRLVDVLPLDMPLVLHLDSTSGCNFRCTFCPQSLPDRERYAGRPVSMDPALYEKILDELADWGRLKVLRFGMYGEPFLNPKFPDMLEAALRRNVADRIVIFTNGVLLDSKTAERLCDATGEAESTVYVRFSVVSVIPEKHRRLTGSNVDIEKIRENVAVLKSLRDRTRVANLGLCAKMIDARSEENDRFVETYRGLVDDVELDAPGNWTGLPGTDFIANIYDGPVETAPPRPRKACSFPFYYLGVNPGGGVTACTDDWCRNTVVGDARTQTLRDIWNGEALQKIRMLHLAGKREEIEICRNCGQIYKNPESDDVDSLSPEDWIARTR